MFNMIKADTYRMSKNIGIKVFFASLIIVYSISLFTKMPGGISLGMPVTFADDAKLDVRMMGMNFTWLFLLIIPVYVIVTADFGDKTVKNTISSAISRKKYYFVKTAFAEFFALFTFLGVNVLFYFINRVKNGTDYSSDFSVFFKVVLVHVPVVMMITAVLILVAFWLKKTATYNAVTIVAPLAYTLLALTLYSINSTKSFAENVLMKYEIGYMFNRLADNCSSSYRNVSFAMSFGVFAVALIAGYLLFTRREID